MEEESNAFVVPDDQPVEANNRAGDVSEANILPGGRRRRRVPARYTPECTEHPFEDDYSLSEYDTEEEEEEEDEDYVGLMDEDEDEDEDYVPEEEVEEPRPDVLPASGARGSNFSVVDSEKKRA